MVACESLLPSYFIFLCPLMDVFGYPLVFIINLIGSATIFFPTPAFALVFFMAGTGFDPWLLAFFASLGAAIGEMIGYAVGAGGRKLAERREQRKGFFRRMKKGLIEKTKEWSKRRGFFLVIVIFAATPLPDDIAGIIAGAIGYDPRKFIGASFIGKMIMFSVLAWAGSMGMEWILDILSGGL